MDDPLHPEAFPEPELSQELADQPEASLGESNEVKAVEELVFEMDPGLSGEDGFTGDDLEQAYQRALEAVEFSEAPAEVEDVTEVIEEGVVEAEQLAVLLELPAEETSVEPEEKLTTEEQVVCEEIPVLEELPASSEPAAILPLKAAPSKTAANIEESEEARVTPTQVLEAVLFVGGPPMTARKLAGILKGSSDGESVERMIDEINHDYSAQNRPYEIRLGDGGYRLDLRPEYERLRQRVYGAGPREVRLSQELLEVLALVAYKQPVTAAEMVAVGKKSPEGMLRQLLRRELIALRRNEDNPKEVRYHTTARFLSLFGLGSLEELPRPEDVDLK